MEGCLATAGSGHQRRPAMTPPARLVASRPWRLPLAIGQRGDGGGPQPMGGGVQLRRAGPRYLGAASAGSRRWRPRAGRRGGRSGARPAWVRGLRGWRVRKEGWALPRSATWGERGIPSAGRSGPSPLLGGASRLSAVLELKQPRPSEPGLGVVGGRLILLSLAGGAGPRRGREGSSGGGSQQRGGPNPI